VSYRPIWPRSLPAGWRSPTVPTVADRRYRTQAWQRLRLQVLARDAYVCQIRGARCTGVATTVDHLVPTSQWPEGFWEPENLQAACTACNYGGGAQIAADNRRRGQARLLELEQENQRLERAVEELEIRCEELALALSRHRPTREVAPNGRRPAIR
jgi:hypothetical protein